MEAKRAKRAKGQKLFVFFALFVFCSIACHPRDWKTKIPLINGFDERLVSV
jgi:hypothetical protein